MSAAVPLGLLRHRLLLKRKSVVAEDEGGATTTLTLVGRFWGRVVAQRVRMRPGWDTPARTMSYDITIRRRDDIAEGDVIVWRGLDLGIEAIAPHEADESFLSCSCSRMVATS